MSDQDRRKTPIDHALDLFVFAPVGFVFEARSLLPRFAERGRRELETAKLIGKHLLGREATEQGAERGRANRHAHNTLRVLGLLPTPSDGNGTSHPKREPAIPPGSDRPLEKSGPPDAPRRAPRAVPAVPAPDVATLAIPDYESLSASQVVPRLESLSPEELEAIRLYESHHRHRATILNKIAQLQST
ncbi:MAG: hypothetical protein N2037_06145 [Acidimicrobiales bacterium]|nr:hypothetical protein [Acidimicrobiales bacterium]